MGIQLRKPLFCLFQYLPERNIWFIHCLLGGKLSPKVTDEGAIDSPNGAEEKSPSGRQPGAPFFCFYKERLGTGSSLPVCETTLPSPPSGWAGRYGRWFMGRRPGRKKEDPLQDPPNQSRESRGEKLSPLALFPPVSREKRGPPPGRRPTGRCAPRLRKSPDHPKGTPYRPPPPRRGLFLPKSLDKGSLIG